jgi:hypothetical protein
VPIYAFSQEREAYFCYKTQNWFQAEKAGKLSAMNLNGLSTTSSLQQ